MNLQLTVDSYGRWRVFDTKDALGTFDTWAEADALKSKLTADDAAEEDAPAWTPKSGGY